MRAQRERHLAAVVEIVFDQVPDHPLARQDGRLAWIGHGPLLWRRAGDRRVHQLPRGFQAAHQLGGRAGWPSLAIPGAKLHQRLPSLAQQAVEPAPARTDNMPHQSVDRAQAGPDAEGKLLLSEGRNRLDQERLVVAPARRSPPRSKVVRSSLAPSEHGYGIRTYAVDGLYSIEGV